MSFSMINRHKYPWSFILIYLENIDVVDFLVSSPLKIGKLRHCLHFIKSKTFSFWRFQSLAKIKNFRNKKYIKLLNGGVLIRAGEGEGGGSDFFPKKIKSGGDVYSGPKSINYHSNDACLMLLYDIVSSRRQEKKNIGFTCRC